MLDGLDSSLRWNDDALKFVLFDGRLKADYASLNTSTGAALWTIGRCEVCRMAFYAISYYAIPQ